MSATHTHPCSRCHGPVWNDADILCIGCHTVDALEKFRVVYEAAKAWMEYTVPEPYSAQGYTAAERRLIEAVRQVMGAT